ncbi:MAG: hypothetical protein ACP5XB_22935 [Isosphaeraceae bacterium]
MARTTGKRVWWCAGRQAVLIALILLACGCGRTVLHEPGEPLEWTGPLAENFNYIVGDANDAPLRYEFRNVSRETVRFVEARPDCKCASVDLPKGEFGPGTWGTIGFQIGLSDGPDRVVGSHVLVEYRCGSRTGARLLDLAVNKRRMLEPSPEILDLKPADNDPSGSCAGTLKLTQYSKPGRDFLPLTDWRLDGNVFIAHDSGWGAVQKDGGFIARSKTVEIRTKPSVIDATGTARLSASCGDIFRSTSVPICWSRTDAVKMSPDTVILRSSEPGARIVLDGSRSRPKVLDLSFPPGVRAEPGPDPGSANRLVLSVRRDTAGAAQHAAHTSPFSVTVECGGRRVLFRGSILMLDGQPEPKEGNKHSNNPSDATGK